MGKEFPGLNTIEDDFAEKIISASALDTMMIFTDKGKVYNVKAYNYWFIKTVERKIDRKYVNLSENEKVRDVITIKNLILKKKLFS